MNMLETMPVVPGRAGAEISERVVAMGHQEPTRSLLNAELSE